jgi:enamine deaminase RidA (YjgF/YER057c/UK114 family)
MADDKARKAIWPGTPPPIAPYSPAIKAGGWLFVAGQLASDFETGLAPECRLANPHLGDALRLQSRFVLKNLAALHEAASMDMRTDVVRIYQWFASKYPTDEEYAEYTTYEGGSTWPRISISPYLETRNEYIDDPRPASTGMGIREDGLLVRGTILEVDMISMEGATALGKKGHPVPDGLPSPLAGYSPAITCGDWVFLAGEIPVDWRGDYESKRHRGELSGLAREARTNPYFWYGSSIETQTDYTLSKLEKIAEEAGTTLDRTVKATVYIGHPNDFHGMDRAWQRWFPNKPPARVVIPYMGLGGKGSRVEIALKLLTKSSKLKIATVETSDAPEPLGHEPQAVRCGDFLFVSTQMAFDSEGNLAAETKRHPDFPWYGQPAKRQMEYVLKNVSAISEAAGTRLDQLCRRQCFHDDFTWFAETMQDCWASHFENERPASTTLRIGGPLVVPGAHFVLDLISYVPGR